MTKPRTGIPGVKGLERVVSASAHGEAMATSRYGGGTRTFPPPEDVHAPQKLGDRNNLQDSPRYQNDTPNNWLRGANQNATTKPNFDRSKRR